MARYDLRCEGDRDLQAKLLGESDVARAVKAADTTKEAGVRRQLLSTALRMTRGLSRRLDAAVARCVDTLGVGEEVELYVYPDASFNAACARPESGRAFVLLSSRLVEAFDDAELRFVVGHELGHHLFEHHRIPLSALLTGEGAPTGPLALQLFAWSRYAEISADRAGFVCAGDLDAVARSFFKLASGLASGMEDVRADVLLDQIAPLREELARAANEPRTDWFATHPFSPLRLRAAAAFAASELGGGGGTGSAVALEAEVLDLMSLMEPTYLHGKTEEAELMRRLLMAASLVVAAAEGGISGVEAKAFDGFFGAGTAERLNVAAMRDDLERRTARVRESVPPLRRAQVLRDVCRVALADGHVQPPERAVLDALATGLALPRALVDATLTGRTTLD